MGRWAVKATKDESSLLGSGGGMLEADEEALALFLNLSGLSQLD